ncbi:hypothetical protein L6272_03090 [Microgenomates group bacterium]|nr:hypothetical protein [Microgenomates group bacterium]
MKIIKINKYIFLGITAGIILGSLVTSGIWWYKVKQKNALDSIEMTQLREQASILQNDYRNPSKPSIEPSPLLFIKETNTKQDFYKLDCYDLSAVDSKKPSADWFNSLQEKFNDKEKISYLCDNQETQQVALISQSEIDKGGSGRPGVENFKLQFYNPKTQELLLLRESRGSYLGGWCGKITNWAKITDIYYQCGGGDGPWGTYTEIKVNFLTKEAGIIKECSTFNEKTTCYSYCDSSQTCAAGEFCNLGTHTCVQSCKDSGDCPDENCGAYGPVMGCGGVNPLPPPGAGN